MKYLKIILWICVFFMAGVIFSFSSQNATQSDTASKGIARKVIDTLPQTKHKTEAEKQKITNGINHYVRKFAHFAAFFMLGLFLLCAMLLTYSHKYSVLKIILISAIIALLYAISDEIHQMFIPNRGPQVKDVFIDFSGSVCAFLLIMAARTIILKKSSITMNNGEIK